MAIPIIAAIAAKIGTAAKAAKAAKVAGTAAKAAKGSKAMQAMNVAQSAKSTKPRLSIGMLANKGGDTYSSNSYKDAAKGFARGAANQSGEPIELSKPSELSITQQPIQTTMPDSANSVYAEQIRKLKALRD